MKKNDVFKLKNNKLKIGTEQRMGRVIQQTLAALAIVGAALWIFWQFIKLGRSKGRGNCPFCPGCPWRQEGKFCNRKKRPQCTPEQKQRAGCEENTESSCSACDDKKLIGKDK